MIIGGILLILIIYGLISSAIENNIKKQQEDATNDILNDKCNQKIISSSKKLITQASVDNPKDMFPVKLNPKVEVSKENLHCPDCKDGYLVVRKGRYGKFIGCTNFPNCTHTEGKNNLKKFKKFEEETRKLEIQPFWDLIDYIYQKNV